MTRRGRLRLASLTLSSLLVLSGTTGCSDDSSRPADPEPTGAFLSEAATPDAEDGLPADFPRDIVPVLDGEVASSDGDAEAGFSVTTNIYSAEAGPVLDQAIAALEDAGWELTDRTDELGFPSASLRLPAGGLVILQAFPSDDDVNLTYFARVDS